MKKYNRILILTLSVSISGLVFSKDIVTGVVYEIIENDAEIELMERVKNVNWNEELKKKNDVSTWAAVKSEYLPIAQETILRSYVPFYKTEFEIKDNKGKIIYPKGYSFNPLRFMTMPNKIYILTPSTAKFFKGKISNRDQIIIANGNPLDQREVLNAPVFTLDEKTKDRLGIEKAPSIVWQEGALLKIQEISIKDLTNEVDD